MNTFLSDPRFKVVLILFTFLCAGILFLGVDRTFKQYFLMLSFACVLDVFLCFVFKSREQILKPYSAMVTGTGLSILTHFGPSLFLGFVPILIALVSKYLFTYKGKHIWNPGLFGIVACLLFSRGMIGVAPATQWGGLTVLCLLFSFAALSVFVFNLKRQILTLSFLVFYFFQLLLRVFIFDVEIPAATLFMGAFQSPAFYLFTFFMLTDPKTSLESGKGQLLMSFSIVAIDLVLHLMSVPFSLFYAGFIFFATRFLYLHLLSCGFSFILLSKVFGKWRELSFTFVLVFIFLFSYQVQSPVFTWAQIQKVGFSLEEVSVEQTGMLGRESDLLQKVDPRMAHVAKWFYSLGDAVAIADVNNDGLQDVFLTQPLKFEKDRAHLYLNKGSFQFEKFDISTLSGLRKSPEKHGSPTQALWVDYDNDGDQDLVLSVFWGKPFLIQNMLKEKGELSFKDVSNEVGLTDYLNSGSVEAADFNNDGYVDLVFAGTLPLYVSKGEYKPEKYFNIFRMPESEHSGDKRMLNVMRRNPYNSTNASENVFYFGSSSGVFKKKSSAALGVKADTHWTLDIGVGDLNNDGWMDVYFANTAGPDRMYFNKEGRGFKSIQGDARDQVGRDTYRGMNVGFADFDQNGFQDIYVSNMHKSEIPEGSLLWMNMGLLDIESASNFVNQSFDRNIFNYDRFGWGAAVGDIDMDGDTDVLQTAGWLDNVYDKKAERCSDYIYKLVQIESTPSSVHGYAQNWPDMRGGCVYEKDPKRIFLNTNGQFQDVALNTGWSLDDNSRAVALADFDNDGDLDVVTSRMTAPVSIYKNKLKKQANWVGFSLKGNGKTCNSSAFGTSVRLKKGGAAQLKYILASNGLGAQSDSRVLFALDEGVERVEIEVSWCGRWMESHTSYVRKYHAITQK